MSEIDEDLIRSIDAAADEPGERRLASRTALREAVLADDAAPVAHLARRRRRRVASLVGIGVAAGVAAAVGVAVVPGILGGGQSGDGGAGSVWAAVSEPLTPELQAEAAEACGATEDWWQDPRIGPFDPAPAPGTPIDERVRLADKRGDRIQLVISNGELPSNWGPEMILEQLQTCTYRADTGKAVAGLPFSRYDAADFTAGQAVSQVALIEVGGTWGEIGQTQEGVVSMTAEHLGLEMEVKIEDGFYSLWWPHGSKTQLDELHWEDPKASVVYTITFADGHTETLTDTPWSFDWADKLEERAPHVDGGGTAWEDADSAEPLTPELTADAAEACVADPDWAPWEGDGSSSPAERVVLAEKRGDLIILILTVADGSTMWHGAPVDADCTYQRGIGGGVLDG